MVIGKFWLFIGLAMSSCLRSLMSTDNSQAVTNCRCSAASTICQKGELCGAHQVLAETLSLVVTLSQKNSVARIASLLLRIRSHLPEDPKRPTALTLQLPEPILRIIWAHPQNGLPDAGGFQDERVH
jgi:hypothetical protein